MQENIGVGSWVARHARITPESTGLHFEGETISYGTLAARTQRLAAALRAHGVGSGDRVAFLGHNHPVCLEVLFACGLLGAVAMPMHPGLEVDVLEDIVVRARPKLIFFTRALADKARVLREMRESVPQVFVPNGAKVVDHEAGAGHYDAFVRPFGDTAAIDEPVNLESPVLLSFTSGTSGRPKGVCLSHQNLLFNAMNVLIGFDYRRDDVLLTSAPLYRLGGLGFLLPMLLKGGCCVLQAEANPATSLELIAQHGVTVLFDGVPSLQRVNENLRTHAASRLTSLRIIITGGSQVPQRLLSDLEAAGLDVQQGYGLTEAAPVALLQGASRSKHAESAGRPPLFASAKVMTSAGAPAAPGEVGELWVRGPNVMLGYFEDELATNRALGRDGWLRTGDAVRQLDDGHFTILGRMGDALTINDRVVHPFPIEDGIARECHLAACALVQAEPNGALTLFAVPKQTGLGLATEARQARDDDEPSPEEATLLSQLDEQMQNALGTGASRKASKGGQPQESPVNCSVRLVPSLPRNANGKLMRRVLVAALRDVPAMRRELLRPQQQSVAPR